MIPFAGQKSDDLMPKQMRIDPFFDPSGHGVFVDDLSDAITACCSIPQRALSVGGASFSLCLGPAWAPGRSQSASGSLNPLRFEHGVATGKFLTNTKRRCDPFRSGDAYWVLSQLPLCNPYWHWACDPTQANSPGCDGGIFLGADPLCECLNHPVLQSR
jgi:hypothetical protein